MITDHIKERIIEEESFRREIRELMDKTKKKESSKTLEFFNSPVGLWLLSTVLIGIVTWAYTTYKETSSAHQQKDIRIQKMDIEIASRLQEYSTSLDHPTTYGQYYGSYEQFISHPLASRVIYADLSDNNLKSLLMEMLATAREDRKDIIKALMGLTVLQNMLLPYPAGYNTGMMSQPLPEEYITSARKLKETLREYFYSDRWKPYMF